jgi:hypothetical protein
MADLLLVTIKIVRCSVRIMGLTLFATVEHVGHNDFWSLDKLCDVSSVL